MRDDLDHLMSRLADARPERSLDDFEHVILQGVARRRDDIQAALTAVFPQCPEMPSIEPDDAGLKTMRVQIVIENEVQDMCAAIAAMPQKKGAAFARLAAAPLP